MIGVKADQDVLDVARPLRIPGDQIVVHVQIVEISGVCRPFQRLRGGEGSGVIENVGLVDHDVGTNVLIQRAVPPVLQHAVQQRLHGDAVLRQHINGGGACFLGSHVRSGIKVDVIGDLLLVHRLCGGLQQRHVLWRDIREAQLQRLVAQYGLLDHVLKYAQSDFLHVGGGFAPAEVAVGAQRGLEFGIGVLVGDAAAGKGRYRGQGDLRQRGSNAAYQAYDQCKQLFQRNFLLYIS